MTEKVMRALKVFSIASFSLFLFFFHQLKNQHYLKCIKCITLNPKY